MKKIKIMIFVVALSLGVILLMPGQVTFAATSSTSTPAQEMQNGVNSIGGGNSKSVETLLPLAVDTMLYFVGALSVIMIIYSGLKYITSNGDSTSITSAKNTLMYAIIGLIVAVLAFAIAHYATHIFDPSADAKYNQQNQLNSPPEKGSPGYTP